MGCYDPACSRVVLVLFVIGRGLSKGVEAANKVFLPLLVILFLALVVRALFLPGRR